LGVITRRFTKRQLIFATKIDCRLVTPNLASQATKIRGSLIGDLPIDTLELFGCLCGCLYYNHFFIFLHSLYSVKVTVLSLLLLPRPFPFPFLLFGGDVVVSTVVMVSFRASRLIGIGSLLLELRSVPNKLSGAFG